MQGKLGTKPWPLPETHLRRARIDVPTLKRRELVFLFCSDIVLLMRPDLNKLKLADYEKLSEALAYALRHYSGKKIARDADQFMAGIVAKRLLEHLDMCGFVVMSGEPTEPHSTP
jgi:hypothetical protein